MNAYSQLFATRNALGLPDEATEEAFRRMAFNVMARNCDDHTKSFSFCLKQGQGWELAPAYEITFVHNSRGEWTHQQLMSVNGKFQNFGREDLLAEASRFGVGTARAVLAQVGDAIAQWPGFADTAGVSAAQGKAIQAQFIRL